ncbi:hypothetical protein VIC_000913 [Vibrio coralliilyticus ATCC BAA-450]|nr:hypothetical protein VIC_000913 [Vibrio coralliilyticus ATCC BAA-450]
MTNTGKHSVHFATNRIVRSSKLPLLHPKLATRCHLLLDHESVIARS